MTVMTEPGITWQILLTNTDTPNLTITKRLLRVAKQDVKDLILASPKMTKNFREFWVAVDLGSDP